MKNLANTYKRWLIVIAIPILIYFIWGYFGFAGAWIPGKYDKENKQYNVFWGLGTKLTYCNKGTFRIVFYTPFKRAGLIDTNGKVLIPFLYKKVFYDTYYSGRSLNYFLAENLDGKFGAINKGNQVIIPFEYDKSPYPYPNGHYLRWEKNNKRGLSNRNGMVVPSEYSGFVMPYEHANPFTIAGQNNYCYFIFLDSKRLKKDFVVYSYSAHRDYIVIEGVKSDDLDSNIWINKIDAVKPEKAEKNRQVIINKQKLANLYYGVFDTLGKEILPLKYDTIKYFGGKNGAYLVKKNNKVGVFNVIKKEWEYLPKYKQLEYLNGYLPLTKIQKTKGTKPYWVDDNGVVILSGRIKVVEINLATPYAQEYLVFIKNKKRYKLEYDGNSFIWYRL